MQTDEIQYVVLLVFVMAVLMTIALVMLAVSFLFKINSMSMFDIARTSSVDLNGYPWRCRQVAINEDIYVGSGRSWQSGRSRQTGKAGKPCIGIFETEGARDCGHYQHGKYNFCTHYGSCQWVVVFVFFDIYPISYQFRTLETEKPGLKYT